MLTRCAPYFPVPDVRAAGLYYEKHFGFACEYSAGEPPVFAVYGRDALPLMFRLVTDPSLISPNEKQGGTWDAFYWVDDVHALFDELAGRGATIVYEPTVQPYGMKEFAVRDLNGYVLGFGQQV